MSNGDLINQVLSILNQEHEVPDISMQATAKLTLAAQVQIYGKLNEMETRLDKQDKCLEDLFAFRDAIKMNEQASVKRSESRKAEINKFYYAILVMLITTVVNVVLTLLRIY